MKRRAVLASRTHCNSRAAVFVSTDVVPRVVQCFDMLVARMTRASATSTVAADELEEAWSACIVDQGKVPKQEPGSLILFSHLRGLDEG